METWVLVMILCRDDETVPVRVPMKSYEQCMAKGNYAESVASNLKGIKIVWTCQPGEG
jgi:hypothetical protein